MTWPPTLTGPEPVFCACLIAFSSPGEAASATGIAPPVLLPGGGAAICLADQRGQFVYSSASALSSFSACLYALG
jgi:hypothetical protein